MTNPDTASATSLSFSELMRSRHSSREFLPTPLPAAEIRGVLEDAQSAPSSSNTQPWHVHIISGTTRDELSERLLAAYDNDDYSADFTSEYGNGLYLERAQHLAATTYAIHGVARSDHEGRREVVRKNLRFYGAPHVALLFVPRIGDSVRAAGDIGMYTQNFLLSLTARGYNAIPQAVLGQFAGTVRETLNIPAEYQLLHGIAFGTADPDSPLSNVGIGRVSLEDSVVIHDTPGVLDES